MTLTIVGVLFYLVGANIAVCNIKKSLVKWATLYCAIDIE